MLTRTQLADIMDALSEARERFDAEADVEDGDYGLPRPNKAMRTVMKIDLAITLCLNEFDAMPVEPFPANAAAMGT